MTGHALRPVFSYCTNCNDNPPGIHETSVGLTRSMSPYKAADIQDFRTPCLYVPHF